MTIVETRFRILGPNEIIGSTCAIEGSALLDCFGGFGALLDQLTSSTWNHRTFIYGSTITICRAYLDLMKNDGLSSNLAQHSSLSITLSNGYIWFLYLIYKKITS